LVIFFVTQHPNSVVGVYDIAEGWTFDDVTFENNNLRTGPNGQILRPMYRTFLSAHRTDVPVNGNYVVMIMFNPSNAGGTGQDDDSDQTTNIILDAVKAGEFNAVARQITGNQATTITGVKIINIFSYRSPDPKHLKVTFQQQLRIHWQCCSNAEERCEANEIAFRDIDIDNDLMSGRWEQLLDGATLIVPAWGDCGSIRVIEDKKEQVLNWLQQNYRNKLGVHGLSQKGNPFHPRGWNNPRIPNSQDFTRLQ